MTKPHDGSNASGGSVSRYHVLGMAYASESQALHVRLASGIYRFEHVPKDLADDFAAASDQDAFFRTRIDERFPSTYLTPDMPDYSESLTALDKAEAAPAKPKATPAPTDVGTATMLADGTLQLNLRAETGHGIAESLLVIPPGDKRYDGMLKHLGGIKPGGSCRIPPFTGP